MARHGVAKSGRRSRVCCPKESRCSPGPGSAHFPRRRSIEGESCPWPSRPDPRHPRAGSRRNTLCHSISCPTPVEPYRSPPRLPRLAPPAQALVIFSSLIGLGACSGSAGTPHFRTPLRCGSAPEPVVRGRRSTGLCRRRRILDFMTGRLGRSLQLRVLLCAGFDQFGGRS